MKKIMKRLLTGVLTLATVFTALPVVTQVHAADSVYTTTDGKAGTIVKIDNGGSEVSSFEESIMNADGQIAYCIDINTNFQSGYKNRINATERMSDDQISDVALNLEYVKQYAEKHSLSSKQVYLLEQCVVWRRLSVHLGWGYNNVRAAYDEVSEKIQSEVYENAKAFAKENKDRYDCGGYIYVGEGQDLGQFWAKLAVGDGKIQKSSSNTAITKSNDCYSLSGATYGVYSDKGCTKSVATLTTNASGNTDTVELRAATYYVKETKAPKGFQLDKNVYTMTVKAGETSTLKVSDTPKVADTLVELFKIDMETSKATSQGNASLEGAEFVWKYYDGYYTKDNLPSEPTRTWTTKTIAEKDSKNEVHYITRLADSYKVSGDSFFTQSGVICLPLGTITVEEKSAPNGYLLEGAYIQAAGSSEVHIIFLIFVLCCFNDYFQFICIIVFQRECSCQLQKNGICPCIQNCELSSYIEVICFFGDVIAYLICFCTSGSCDTDQKYQCNYCCNFLLHALIPPQISNLPQAYLPGKQANPSVHQMFQRKQSPYCR